MITGKKHDMPRQDTEWKKGQSGNPKGRPVKGYSITEMMRELMESTQLTKDGKQVVVREAITKSIMQKALDGDVTAQKLIWQYMDGLPKQKIDIGTDTDEAVDTLHDLIEQFSKQKVKP